MAVTRAMNKTKIINKKSQKKMEETTTDNYKMKDVVIKLDRLTKQQITGLTAPQKNIIEQQKQKYNLRTRKEEKTEKKNEQKSNKKVKKTTAIAKSSNQSATVLWLAAKKQQREM